MGKPRLEEHEPHKRGLSGGGGGTKARSPGCHLDRVDVDSAVQLKSISFEWRVGYDC